jgi:hypothetical protein
LGAFKALLTELQRCSALLLEGDHINHLPFALGDYDLTENSTFLDIGSGFGKPVFHASLQTYCHSKGIEVLAPRVAVADAIKWERIDRIEARNREEREKMESLQTNNIPHSQDSSSTRNTSQDATNGVVAEQ